jgi:hypothetical protein
MAAGTNYYCMSTGICFFLAMIKAAINFSPIFFKALGSFLAREFLVAKWNPSSLTARLID